MAQQQPRREEFQHISRTDDRERDVDKNVDEFGTRTATDPVAPYAYGSTAENAGGGAAGGAYGGGNMQGDYGGGTGTTGYNYEYTAVYGTPGAGAAAAPGYDANTGSTATTGYGTAGVDAAAAAGGGQWGRAENTDRGGRNRNMGRDQK